MKVLLALLDEEALAPPCRNKADLLCEDQPVLSGSEGTCTLLLFRSVTCVQYQLMCVTLRILMSYASRIAKHVKNANKFSPFQAKRLLAVWLFGEKINFFLWNKV